MSQPCRGQESVIVQIRSKAHVLAGRDSRLRSVGNDEREQTLNQLLTELDGFESEKDAGPVICIAATNRPDVSCKPPAAVCKHEEAHASSEAMPM